MKLSPNDLKGLLDQKAEEYNRPGFIHEDPISVPHLFKVKQDIEIAGFLAATIAWGQRKTIVNNGKRLMTLMDNAPYDFVRHHQPRDLQRFNKFCHRTFNPTDLRYFIRFFADFYKRHDSLEEAFVAGTAFDVEESLAQFHETFFSLPKYPRRTVKHVATPQRKSACKRINMFLRWMVRKDERGVDFGIWSRISPSALICPCDVHVERVARKLKLIKRKQVDWLAATELTSNLRKLDPKDPVKYDFALFGLGLEGF